MVQANEAEREANLDTSVRVIYANLLCRLAEIIEEEIEQYIKLDPDPFDDRHPFRTHPQCTYGQSLKTLYKKEAFMDKLVSHYMKDRWGTNDLAVNTAACRLFIGILPGLESSAVYQARTMKNHCNKMLN